MSTVFVILVNDILLPVSYQVPDEQILLQYNMVSSRHHP